MKVAFFRCDKCGEWRYSTKNLKITREYGCIKCAHKINLDKVESVIYDMPNRSNLKVKVLQELKIKGKKI
ncbi:MAG: hypothetical protein ACFFG0_34245 [Candidatus Thorarchaeota archaeon]